MARIQSQASGGSTSTESLIKTAHLIFDNCDINMSPSKVTRIVREYQYRVAQNGFSFFAFLANTVQLSIAQQQTALLNPDIARVISYADPTGERAVSNVLKPSRS